MLGFRVQDSRSVCALKQKELPNSGEKRQRPGGFSFFGSLPQILSYTSLLNSDNCILVL